MCCSVRWVYFKKVFRYFTFIFSIPFASGEETIVYGMSIALLLLHQLHTE